MLARGTLRLTKLAVVHRPLPLFALRVLPPPFSPMVKADSLCPWMGFLPSAGAWAAQFGAARCP